MAALSQYAIAVAAGVVSHVAYFSRSEHHMRGITYLRIYGLIYLAGVLAICRLGHAGSYRAAVTTMMVYSLYYFAGLYASLLVYRGFLNPLNKFPGRPIARFTSLWMTSQCASNSDAYKQMDALHRKYGDFVRVGSHDLSTTHPDAVQALYGAGSKCVKGQWYDQDQPRLSMHTSRARALHDRRRRIWSPAFSDRALRGYERRIETHSDELVRQIGAFSSGSVDVSKWFNLYSFDVMGDLAFGKGFGMLQSGEEHYAVKLLQAGMEAQGAMLPPWLFIMVAAIPGLAAGYWKFIDYCSERLARRMEQPKDAASEKDIMATLLEGLEGDTPSATELNYLQGDSRLIIVAGSDTTAATLTYLFHHLAAAPAEAEKLRAELGPYVLVDGSVAHQDIQNLPHLNGAINEALRLHPPVPTALQRVTPPEGIMLGDTHIPGSTTIFVPQYAMGHSEANYEHAHAFVPERWYSRPEMIKNKSAWFPFSIGPYGCIGKPLALLEIRTVVAKLVTAYDINYAPGEDGTKLLNESRDHFTVGLAPLNLQFTRREK